MSAWERLASLEGGTVSWLATAGAADGQRHVFAATAVGVFRSTDRGLSWQPLGGASRVPGAEVVVPSPDYADDGVVFVGALDGLFRWRDGGGGWEHLLSGSRVLSAAVVRGAPSARGGGSALFVLAGTETDGVLISRDGGTTWEGANAGLLDLEVLALAVSPDFARDGLGYAATPTAVYRTRNGAESWREVELPSSGQDDVGAQCLAVSPGFAEDRVVLAGGLDSRCFRSEDRGRSWEEVPDLDGCEVSGIACLPGGRVVAATDRGVALSEDGGVRWRLVGEELGGVLSVTAIDDGERIVLLAGVAQHGVWRSEDGGATWTAAHRGLAALPFVGLLFSEEPERGQTVYAYGLEPIFGVSRDGGQTWTTHDGDIQAEVAVAALPGGRLVRVSDPSAVWAELERSLGQGDAVAVAVAPDSVRGNAQAAFVVVAGRAGGRGRSLTLWWTADRGRRWDRWLELPDVPGGAVRLLALPPNHWGDTVVLGYGARVLRPRPNAWEVREGARRPIWDEIALPGEDAAGRRLSLTSLAASPAYPRDRTLFAASSAGVYVSRDGGASFVPWSDGLEPCSLVDVAPSPAYARDRRVYALGLGGTIWRRHDGELPTHLPTT